MKFSFDRYSLEGDFRTWAPPKWNLTSEADGTGLLTVEMTAKQPPAPEPFTLEFTFPRRGAVGRWIPAADRATKYLAPDWDGSFETDLSLLQPTVCFFDGDGVNSAAVALSEVGRRLKITAGVRGDGMLRCRIDFFSRPEAPSEHYRFTMRIDRRKLPFHQVLREMAEWYEAQPEFRPPPTPEAAWEPVFSSWYAYQQDICDHELEAECVPAHAAGMTTLITEEGGGGYAYCGDWKPAKRRFPDMKRHIDRVHSLGMRYLLWYSVPFIGVRSGNFERFRGKYLYCRDDLGAWVLDPRFPEVREFLSGTYERALREWGPDGFKLDFIDTFEIRGEDPAVAENYAGRDFKSLPEAVDVLLSETMRRLRAIKPEVMIEFRQRYIGPAMRKYGNMFRAADCPNDAVTNRVRTIDVRMLAGDSAVHADMLMWNYAEPVETAALQLLNVLFSVPQVSVRLEAVPAEHRAMLRFYLGFWREYRDVLLDGTLRADHPELDYPRVTAIRGRRQVTALYAQDQVVEFAPAPGDELCIVNASGKSGVYLDLAEAPVAVELFSATGMALEIALPAAGPQRVGVPAAGLLRLRF